MSTLRVNNIEDLGLDDVVTNGIIQKPASVSVLTYQAQLQVQSGTTAYLNRAQTDADSTAYGRTSSTLTLMEIAG